MSEDADFDSIKYDPELFKEFNAAYNNHLSEMLQWLVQTTEVQKALEVEELERMWRLP